MDEIIKDAKFSNIELKGDLDYQNINFTLNRNNITINDKGLEKNIERNLQVNESGFNFIINSQNKTIKLVLPRDTYIGVFYNIYINNNIKSLEVIPSNNNDENSNNNGDKIFGNYNIISSNNYSLSTLEKKSITTQHKVNGSNKISLINESSGILQGGYLTIKCVDKIFNDVEGLNVRDLKKNEGVIYWNTPNNMYNFSHTNHKKIKYNIKRLLNDKWITIKTDIEDNYYHFQDIDENNIIYKVCTENSEFGVIINITLPKSNEENDLLDFKVKHDYDYDNKSRYIWSIDGVLNAELNENKNDFESIFK